MNKILLAALLAGTAFVPAAYAQESDGAVQTDQAKQGRVGNQAMTEIRQSIQKADRALDQENKNDAKTALDDAGQKIQTAMKDASGDTKQTYQKLSQKVQQASQAVSDDKFEDARQILVSVQKDDGFKTDASAQVNVDVPEPDVSVQQSDPTVNVQQAQPKVNVDPGRPQVTVNQAAPKVRVKMPQPTITIDMPRPEIVVEMPDPNVSVDTAKPKVSVNQAQPKVSVDQGEAQIEVGGVKTDTKSDEKPDVTVQKGQAKVSVDSSQAQVSVKDAKPQVKYNAAEPDVQVEKAGDPKVQFNQTGEPNVQIRQMSADETRKTGNRDQAKQQDQQEQQSQKKKPDQQQESEAAPVKDTTKVASTNSADTSQRSMKSENRDSANMAVNANSKKDMKLTVDDLENYSVVGSNDNELGDIDKVVSIKNKLYVVVASGGFLGMGEKETAIPLSSLVVSNDRLIAPDVSEAQVQSLKDFKTSAYDGLKGDYAVTVGSM